MVAARTMLYLVTLLAVWVSLAAPSPIPSTITSEDASWEDTSPEEGPFLEGDIVNGLEVIPLIEFRNGHSVRNLVADPQLLWPDKVVYYQFPGGVEDDFRSRVEEALQEIMDVSCVRFIPRPPDQKTYLKLRITGKGCATKVGYHDQEGALDLHVGGNKCHTRGTVQHEFLHALGFWHEHTRPDRDKHISVVWDNVKSAFKNNFLKRSEMESFNLGLPYDYSSVMHYKYTSFAKHRGTPTLVPKVKEAVKVMGQRHGVTWVDIAKLNRLYNCTGEYYRGDDLQDRGAVFGQIVEPKQNRTDGDIKKKIENKNDKSFQEDHDHKKLLQKLKEATKKDNGGYKITRYINIAVSDSDETYETSEKVIQRPIEEFTELLDSEDGRIIMERLMQNDNVFNHSHRTKRETAGAKPQPTGNGEMADQPAQGGGHQSFAPQSILPELLKGVLNNDNNERPIVIQFAIYQPVIYKNENKTDSSSEHGNEDNKSKHIEHTEKSTNNMADGKDRRDGVNIQNSYAKDQEKYNHNLQQQEHEEFDLRKSSDEDYLYRKGYTASPISRNEYIPPKREFNEKDDTFISPHREFIPAQDVSEEDQRSHSVERTEYSSSFQVPQKGGDKPKPSAVDDSISSKIPFSADKGTISNNNHETQQISQKRITPNSEEDFAESPRISFKEDGYYTGISNKEYIRPVQTSETHDDRMIAPRTDNIKPLQVSQRKDSDYTPLEKKTVAPIDTYAIRKEEYTSSIEKPRDPEERIGYNPDLKDGHVSLHHDIAVGEDTNSDISHDYETRERNEHESKGNSHDFVHSAEHVYEDYHSPPIKSEQKNDDYAEQKDTFNPTAQSSEQNVDHLIVTKHDSQHVSDTYGSSSYNLNPVKTPPRKDDEVIKEPALVVVKQDKSTERPLDLEVGPPKPNPPLISNGDGENVAPNWNRGMVLEYPEKETLQMPPRNSESFGEEVISLNNPVKKEKSTGYRSPVMDDISESQTKVNTLPVRRPDLVIEEAHNDKLDQDIRRMKLEKKLEEEMIDKRPVISEAIKQKSEPPVSKDTGVQRRTQSNAKVVPLTPSPPQLPKKPSNPRREVQEEDLDSIDADRDLFLKPNTSKVNLNPRQALPLNANATIKMNYRRVFRKERV